MNSTRNSLLTDVSDLMNSQADAFVRLETATKALSVGLMKHDLAAIEKQSRAGECELTEMRARLLETMKALTRFAEEKAKTGETLDPAIKSNFEASAKKLIDNAKEFKRLADRTSQLVLGGASFSTACIQECGIPATTYNKPVFGRKGAYA